MNEEQDAGVRAYESLPCCEAGIVMCLDVLPVLVYQLGMCHGIVHPLCYCFTVRRVASGLLRCPFDLGRRYDREARRYHIERDDV